MKKHRIIGLVLMLLLLVPTLFACGADETAPADTSAEAIDENGTSVTSGADEEAPMEISVEIIGENGASIPYYNTLIAGRHDGVHADGMLMFRSVSEYLPDIAGDLTAAELGGTPEIRVTVSEGMSFSGGRTVDVYGEDYELLAEDVPLAELVSTGESSWAGQTVYVYFVINFYQTDGTDYMMSAYFIKTMF